MDPDPGQQLGGEQQKPNFSPRPFLPASGRASGREALLQALRAGKVQLKALSSGQEVRRKGKGSHFLSKAKNKDLQVFPRFTHTDIFSSGALRVLAATSHRKACL